MSAMIPPNSELESEFGAAEGVLSICSLLESAFTDPCNDSVLKTIVAFDIPRRHDHSLVNGLKARRKYPPA